MLTVVPLHSGRASYYVEDVASGRAEGTGVQGEPPGRWVAGAAAGLGLDGDVGHGALAHLLDGRRPDGAGDLGAADRRTVGGFDLTFAAPKSVSVLALLGPEAVAGAARASHRAATDAALGYLADHALVARRRSGGDLRLVTTTGWLAGAFDHHTSRALDPHLHTHVVAANAVHGADGRWSGLDSRRLFAHHRAAGALYQAELRAQLTGRLGVGWDDRGRGLADVAGVDPALRGLFSQRSAEIRRYLTGVPGTSHRAAFYATRPDKDRRHSVADLVPGWRERAAAFGLDLDSLSRVPGPNASASGRHPFDPGRVVEGLSQPRWSASGAAVAHVELVALVAAAHPVGAPVATVVQRVSDLEREAGGATASGPAGSPRVGSARGERFDVATLVGALGRGVGVDLGGPAPVPDPAGHRHRHDVPAAARQRGVDYRGLDLGR